MTPEKPYWREIGDHLVGFLREFTLGELPGEGGRQSGNRLPTPTLEETSTKPPCRFTIE
jgi:hypothetical protein